MHGEAQKQEAGMRESTHGLVNEERVSKCFSGIWVAQARTRPGRFENELHEEVRFEAVE